MSSEPATIWELLQAGGDDDLALLAPGRAPLTYRHLRDQTERTIAVLNHLGIGRGDRVAIVLPNGPEMAAAFVGIAAGATTAPLNPAYRREEFAFTLSDVGAAALAVERDSSSIATEVASGLGIPVLEISSEPGAPAGSFDLSAREGVRQGPALTGGMSGSDDVALVLHTSGTTSRPKIVPLSHRNVCASARNMCRTLELQERDRCLNVMPLFHIHGLMAAILSSLSAGASVCCSPGFNALRFFSWLDEARPSWYTAVPTMHQAILARADRNRPLIAKRPLRFVRSSSSALPPQVMKALEDTFACPVIEAYSMTEAAHQMTCNPLPPRARKPGTVGIAAGPEIGVMDPEGRLLPSGSAGELVIRGTSVTLGYENNAQANAECFTRGWFRTGDQGVLDEQGYVTITGRLKEVINRGGEKVSPREVDDVLMDHPAIEQVVTFAMPHDKLGEEVAAAVVLREGHEAEERELRRFAAERLAEFKVPRKILFLDELPKGSTGKPQRIGLAEKLGLAGPMRGGSER